MKRFWIRGWGQYFKGKGHPSLGRGWSQWLRGWGRGQNFCFKALISRVLCRRWHSDTVCVDCSRLRDRYEWDDGTVCDDWTEWQGITRANCFLLEFSHSCDRPPTWPLLILITTFLLYTSWTCKREKMKLPLPQINRGNVFTCTSFICFWSE